MKKPFLTIAVLCTFFALMQGCKKNEQEEPGDIEIPCLPATLKTNVVAFYPFSNGSLKDFSGNNMHLVNNTTAKAGADRNGSANCAYEFDNYPNNTESLFTGSTQLLTGLNTFSISLWYQPLDTAVQSLTAKEEDMVSFANWRLELFDCRKATFWMVENNTTTNKGEGYSVWDKNTLAWGTPNICQEEQKLRTGNWHHLAVTFDKANDIAKIYRDNVLQEGEGRYINDFPFTSLPNLTNLVIGSGYTGRLDDIVIFNKALSDAEIGLLFNMGTCCSE